MIDGTLAETWKPPHYICWGHLLQAHPAFCRYLTYPRLVALVEEVVGGKVRLDESAAIVNRRLPDFDPGARFRYQWHRGGQPDFDSYTYGGLYHCTFVKTLTNLRDLGPEDGGTAVIAGSHKLNCREDDMVGAAYEDPALVHQVAAPAGSTLVMCETLIHATGQNRGDGERAIIIGGYSHPKDMAMAGWEPTPGVPRDPVRGGEGAAFRPPVLDLAGAPPQARHPRRRRRRVQAAHVVGLPQRQPLERTVLSGR